MIGKRLKELRKANNLVQADVAKIVGVQKPAVSMYESGKHEPSDEIKVKLAKFFNVSLDYLLGVVDEPVPYYDQNRFLQIREDLSNEEKIVLTEINGYFDSKREKD